MMHFLDKYPAYYHGYIDFSSEDALWTCDRIREYEFGVCERKGLDFNWN